ncbi:MAG: hypothetical protein JWO30_4182 [Fibrobacteres bacterium]|nr:hypothetical protein [Fibrobacterota bacterium]
MKKIIFWGDGILAGPSGFAELLSNHIFLHHPRADVSTSLYGGETATWQDAVKETPLHVIGKAPVLVVLGFGYTDLTAGRTPDEIAQSAQGVVTLMLQKTQSRICLLSAVSSFFSEEADRERCHALNRRLRDLSGPRVSLVDLEGRVEWFLAEHKQGPGEKHSLHLDRNRLTPLGRLFMAHHAFDLITWPVEATGTPVGVTGTPDVEPPVPF